MSSTITRKGVLEFQVKGVSKSKGQLAAMTSGLDSLKSTILGAVTAFGSLKATQTAMEWGEEAAKLHDVERAFENMAESAGVDGVALLEKMKKATGETVSELQLMQQANTAMLLDLPVDRFDEILSIARSAALSTGQEMDYMLQSIVTGLGRQSKLFLDNLGILVDVEKAQDDYARSVGVSARDLTEMERKQVFVNAALEAGRLNIEKLGGLVGSETDPFRRLHVEVEELKTAIGEEFLGALSSATGGVNEFVDQLTVTLGDEGFAGVLESLDAEKLAPLFGAGAGSKIGGVFGTAGRAIGALLGAGIAWGVEPGIEKALREGAVRESTDRIAKEFQIRSKDLIEGSRDLMAQLTRWGQMAVPKDVLAPLARDLSAFNSNLGEATSTFSNLVFAEEWLGQLGDRFHDLGIQVQEGSSALEALEATAGNGVVQEALFSTGSMVAELRGQYLDLSWAAVEGFEVMADTSLSWESRTAQAIASVLENNAYLTASFKNALLMGKISSKSIGTYLQEMARMAIAAKSAESAVNALFYAAEGVAAAAFGNFAQAGGLFKSAAMHGAIAAGAGALASIGPSMGPQEYSSASPGYMGSDSLASMPSGGSERSVHVTRTAPVTYNVTHIYHGTVNFGSQDQASAGAIQDVLDAGEIYLPGEVP